jgi:TonB family protein
MRSNSTVTSGYLTYEFSHPPRWNKFLAGLLINALGLLFLIVSGAHLSVVALNPIRTAQQVTFIAPFTAPQVARLETPKLVPPPPMHAEPQPRAEAPVRPSMPKVLMAAPNLPKPVPQPVIKTNVFVSAPSQAATTKLPARKVQTGGFGDPNGLAAQNDPKRDTVMVAKLGSFDLPQGGGHGNGAGGADGVSGTIHSAGFNAPAATASNADDGVVRSSGFGDASPQPKPAETMPAEKKPQLQPVEIVYKPRPAYTPEARRLRVEGEVLLDVVFHADGSLRVNRIVKGLGYGLDDMALAAARQIQFRPARRDGQPYDYAALVHIVFELSR